MAVRDHPPRTILFITRKWGPAMGGMETYCQRLTEELAKTLALDIVALRGKEDGSVPSAASLLGFPFIIARRWLARRDVADILHIADMALWPVGLLAGKHTRVVLSAHGTDVSYPRRGGVKASLYGFYLRLGSKLLRRATVIANSAATRTACRENGWHRSVVVPLAADIRASSPQPPPPQPQPPRGNMLFAGRLIRQKGLRWFVENVLDTLPETFTLDVAGKRLDPAEGAALNHLRVRFLGILSREKLDAAYCAALCVVVPNLELPNGEFEGFGLVACEAAAAGGVVLAANCGGLSEAVIDGATGFLLPPGDARAWHERITRIAGWQPERREAFTRKAVDCAAAHFNWQRVAADTMAVYQPRFEHPGGAR